MRFFSILAVLLCGSLSAEEPKTPSELRGVWRLEKIEHMGQTIPTEKASYEFHFTDTQLIWRFVGDTTGPDQVFNCFPVESNGAQGIDYRSAGKENDSDGNPLHVRAIYKLEGDKLLICSKRDKDMKPSRERPTKFISTKDLRTDLMELTRKRDITADSGD